jgi:uncharacterized surface anchored protein
MKRINLFQRFYSVALVGLLLIQLLAQTAVVSADTASSGTGSSPATDVTPSNFSDFFDLQGSATYEKSTGIVTITPDDYNKVGNFSLKSKISLANDFTLTGAVNLGTRTSAQGGADGIGFAFHTGNTTDIGNAGGNLGIGGLQDALGFKLDTYHNDYRIPQANEDGALVAPTDSNGFGWDADPSNPQFGAFVNTTDKEITATDGKQYQRWWATTDGSSVKQLSDSDLDGKFHDFEVSYTASNRQLTITYQGNEGTLTWEKTVPDSDQAVSMIVSASTGGSRNLQQFKLNQFTFYPAATVNVKYVDTSNNQIAQGTVTYPDGPYVNGTYSTQQLQIPGYLFKEMQAGSLPITGTMKQVGDNGTVVYVYQKLGSVVLTKTDGSTKQPLTGAVFDLYNSDNTVHSKGLTTDSSGQITVTDLIPGNYYFTETKAPDGYELSDAQQPFVISDTSSDPVQLSVTNQKTPETTSVSGKKIWNDNHNQDGQRPDQITVRLLGNGQEVGKTTVSAKDNWQYSFTNLPKNQNGKAIDYTVQEDAVPGYATTINGFDITNTHTTETTSVSGKKTWADNNNQDGQRPDQITVHLLGNGKEVGKATVTAKDNWQYSFGNLPKYENGKAIVYTIQEDKVPGYATTTNGFDITNTHTTETTSISGKKTWADNHNQDGQRPDQITVHLLGNGKEVGKATVTAKDNWQYSFGNLPKYENGKAIVYTIQEDKVPGYATTIKGFDITNTHTTETTSISGKKTWADNHNQDGQRPDQITVQSARQQQRGWKSNCHRKG